MTSKGQDQAALQETHKLNTAARKEEGSGRNESRPEIGAESAMHEFDLYRKKGLQKDPFSCLKKKRMMDLVPLKKHSLTRAQFEQLADVSPEEEWLANIGKTCLKMGVEAHERKISHYPTSFSRIIDYRLNRSETP